MSAARILTVRDPWATLILKYGKDVENRTRNIVGDYRGPVLIHSAKQLVRAGDPAWTVADEAGMDTDRYDGEEFHLGHIIGVVDLVNVHLSRPTTSLNRTGPVCVGTGDGIGNLCSQWAEEFSERGYHLELDNPRMLDEPIPYRGALGLRKTDFGIEGDWLVEYHEPCKYPCAGPEYGCPPSCHMSPVGRLVATS